MNIVLEGPDGAGKSTLATAIHERFERIVTTFGRMTGKRFTDWRIQHSGGPAKSTEEVEERTRVYNTNSRVIFDRHPAVSNPIYASLFHGIGGPSSTVINAFYDTRPLVIYCRSKNDRNHVIKENDLLGEHVKKIHREYPRLLYLYDQWAAEYAQLIYRIEDNLDLFLRTVEARVW